MGITAEQFSVGPGTRGSVDALSTGLEIRWLWTARTFGRSVESDARSQKQTRFCWCYFTLLLNPDKTGLLQATAGEVELPARGGVLFRCLGIAAGFPTALVGVSRRGEGAG